MNLKSSSSGSCIVYTVPVCMASRNLILFIPTGLIFHQLALGCFLTIFLSLALTNFWLSYFPFNILSVYRVKDLRYTSFFHSDVIKVKASMRINGPLLSLESFPTFFIIGQYRLCTSFIRHCYLNLFQFYPPSPQKVFDFGLKIRCMISIRAHLNQKIGKNLKNNLKIWLGN